MAADGTFEVPGPGRAGVPPGGYRVAVAVASFPKGGPLRDRLGHAFALGMPLPRVEVAAGREVVVEIGTRPKP